MSQLKRNKLNSMRKNKLYYFKKYLLFFLGFIFFIIGIIGIFLPIMPTVPFILLSASCFYKSSRRAHYWLINNKLFGKYIRDYAIEKKISPKTKWTTLVILWLSIGFSIYRFRHIIYLPIIHFFILLFISLHILRLGKSKKNI